MHLKCNLHVSPEVSFFTRHPWRNSRKSTPHGPSLRQLWLATFPLERFFELLSLDADNAESDVSQTSMVGLRLQLANMSMLYDQYAYSYR